MQKWMDADFIGDIEYYEKEYQCIHKVPVNKISNWNCEPPLSNLMCNEYQMQPTGNKLDYILPYEIPEVERKNILDRFIPRHQRTKDILLTANGTASIYSLINFFKQKRFHKIAILSPVYFSVPLACSTLDIPFDILPLERDHQTGFFS